MTQLIEVDEAGRLTLPTGLIGAVKPHDRFTVETSGRKLTVEPVQRSTPSSVEALTPEAWKEGWDALVKQISSITLRDGKTALEELTEMRNARG